MPNGSASLSRAGDICSIISLIVAVLLGSIEAYLWIKHGELVMNWALSFFGILVIIMLASAILQFRAARIRHYTPTRAKAIPAAIPSLSEIHHGVDENRLRDVHRQLVSLTRFEIFALERSLSTEGMTGEQFYLVVEGLGFPVVSRPGQDEIIDTFAHIDARTSLLVKNQSDSRWGVKPELRVYVSVLIKQMPPLFGH
jgi:hypothetical protein